jgi:hypothetical protein
MKLEFSRQIFEKNTQASNFMKIGPVGVELFHTNGYDEVQVTFRNFASTHEMKPGRNAVRKNRNFLHVPACTQFEAKPWLWFRRLRNIPFPPIGQHFPRRDLRTSWDHTTYVQQVRRHVTAPTVTGVTVIRHAVTGYVFSTGTSSDAFGMHLVLESWPEAIYSAWGFPGHPEPLPPFRVEGVHEWDSSSASGQRNLLRCFSLYTL